MVMAGVLGTALNTHAAHPYSLMVNGLDLIPPAGLSAPASTPIETVSVTHGAPGTISSMTFTVENTAGGFSVAIGDAVLLWDNVRNRPVFSGFVQTPTRSRLGVGQAVTIVAIGIEAALDWMRLASDMVVTTPSILSDQIQRAYAMCGGVGVGLNTSQPAGHTGTDRGSLATPVGDMMNAFILTAGITITAGTTLRAAITALWNAAVDSLTGTRLNTYSVTVDMYGGLRAWAWSLEAGILGPSDFATLTVLDTYASTLAASGLQHAIDGGPIARAVLVIGGNAAGSGLVSDGTGKPGKTITINDATSLTTDRRNALASSAIAAAAEAPAGQFTLEDWTPQVDVWPGSPVSITDAQLSLGAVNYRLSQMVRTFNASGREDWQIAYGVQAPSYVNAA